MNPNRSTLRAAKRGDRQARAAVVKSMEGLIYRIVTSYLRRPQPHVVMDDLVQESKIAVLDAIRGFREGRYQFNTYAASCVRRRLFNLLDTRSTARPAMRSMMALPQEPERDTTSEGCRFEFQRSQRYIESFPEPEPSRETLHVGAALATLPPLVRSIVRKRFGLEGWDAAPPQRIAEQLGVDSYYQVRFVEAALAELRELPRLVG